MNMDVNIEKKIWQQAKNLPNTLEKDAFPVSGKIGIQIASPKKFAWELWYGNSAAYVNSNGMFANIAKSLLWIGFLNKEIGKAHGQAKKIALVGGGSDHVCGDYEFPAVKRRFPKNITPPLVGAKQLQ